MRDYILLAVLGLICPTALFRPYIGILAWTWVSLMNPHRLAWGIAASFPVAYAVAIPTIIGVAREFNMHRLPMYRETILFFLYWAMISVCCLFARNEADAYEALIQISKIFFMLSLTIFMTDSREKLKLLCIVIVLSLGFYGAKGGLFAILTGGAYRIYGPSRSFIEDNNALALALNITLPLILQVAREIVTKKIRYLFYLLFFLTILAIVFTYSRGGFLGLAVVLSLLILKPNLKNLIMGCMLLIIVVSAKQYIPDQWFERMGTIQTYEEDESAMSRINAWRLAWLIALDNPTTGLGLQAMEDKTLYDIYYPDSPTRNDVHSSYFQVLSESGFFAFGIWISLFLSSIWSCHSVKKYAKNQKDFAWVEGYANAFYIGTVAYLVSGLFLELAAFDYIYLIVGLIICLKNILTNEILMAKTQNAKH